MSVSIHTVPTFGQRSLLHWRREWKEEQAARRVLLEASPEQTAATEVQERQDKRRTRFQRKRKTVLND